MNCCILSDDNTITNIIVCDSDEIAAQFGAVPSYDGARIGDAYDPPPEPEPDTLAENKTARIQQSKDDLETYLAEHPIQWTDGEYYAITQKKQNQLTSKILSATLAAQTSTAYTLTWNSTGEVCKEWTLSDLSALAFAIDARVTQLVTYQQTQEVAIRNASTQEELDAIIIDYDTVL